MEEQLLTILNKAITENKFLIVAMLLDAIVQIELNKSYFINEFTEWDSTDKIYESCYYN